MGTPFTENQLSMLRKSRDALRRRALESPENPPTELYEELDLGDKPFYHGMQQRIFPSATPNHPATQVYPDQLSPPTSHLAPPSFASQGSGGIENPRSQMELHQRRPIGYSILPPTGPWSIGRGGCQWVAGGGVSVAAMSTPYPPPNPPAPLTGAFLGQETSGPSLPLSVLMTELPSSYDGRGASSSTNVESFAYRPEFNSQRDRISVAKMVRNLRSTLRSVSTGASFLPPHGASTVPDTASESYPNYDFAADAQRHLGNYSNNITSSNFDLSPPSLENQGASDDLSISVATDNQLTESSQVSTTAEGPQQPISLPQLSVPISFPEFKSTGSAYNQEMYSTFPNAILNFSSVAWPDNAIMSFASGNQQWINFAQNSYQCDAQYPPSNPSALSQTGVVRTDRGTARQQSTPMGRRKEHGNEQDRPNFTQDSHVICQWNGCGQSFSTPRAFESHCRDDHNISGSKPAKAVCEWSGCKRGSKDSLLRHILAQHAKVKYFCDRGCGKSTTRPNANHTCSAMTPTA